MTDSMEKERLKIEVGRSEFLIIETGLMSIDGRFSMGT